MPIERNAPELESIVSSGQSIEKLGDGYGGGEGPAEGPLWWKEGDTSSSVTSTTTVG